MSHEITVSYTDDACYKHAVAISNKLKLPLSFDKKESTIEIIVTNEGVHLLAKEISKQSFLLDFATIESKLRKYGNLSKHPLIKAIGVTHKNATIIDATAGFAKDSVIMKLYGCNVIALEKNPVVSVLIDDAVSRLHNGHLLRDIKFVFADSIIYLSNLDSKPDIIFLDPMFPSRSKNSLVKKPMQILQLLNKYITNDDVGRLLNISLQMATKKVIVKRPSIAGFLADNKPSYQITHGQTTRYDVYLTVES